MIAYPKGFSLLLIFTLVFSCGLLTACGDSGGDDDGPAAGTSIVGVWTQAYTESSCSYSVNLELKSNGTWTQTESLTCPGAAAISQSHSGSWRAAGNNIYYTITASSDPEAPLNQEQTSYYFMTSSGKMANPNNIYSAEGSVSGIVGTWTTVPDEGCSDTLYIHADGSFTREVLFCDTPENNWSITGTYVVSGDKFTATYAETEGGSPTAHIGYYKLVGSQMIFVLGDEDLYTKGQ